MRDGQVVYMIERYQIEGRDAAAIARDLTDAFDRFCQPAGAAAERTTA
jgi:putative YphP/YqiW family bacilliredoxin